MFVTALFLSCITATPSSPKDLVFPEYVFSPPVAEEYKESILGGIPVFIAEDKELPLINLVATFRGGKYLDGDVDTGLSAMMASLVRDGGTKSMTAEDVDERFAFLAASASVGGGGTTVTATLNSLSSNFEESFDLFLEMLQSPGFQQSRIDLEKSSLRESMKQRNDFPSGVLSRENRSRLFGDTYVGRSITIDSIDSISVKDLVGSHADIVNPSNLVLSISGDFNRGEMLDFLSKKLEGWKFGAESTNPPEIISEYVPGIYYVDQDVPQGGVRISVRTFRRGDKDSEAGAVMNHILGGGGFSSRITQKVRSDEGLAYSAGSRFNSGAWSDGVWSAYYESKSPTVALAAKLIFDEIAKIKTTLVEEDELARAKSAIIETFPSSFQSKAGTLGVFVGDELTNRDPLFWQTYRDKISSVTAQDIKNVANRILDPKKMAVVIVGNWGEIKNGDADGRATMADVSAIVGGEIIELPLRDPLTLQVAGD